VSLVEIILVADRRPKHKHIVLPSWVTESVDEETLMNEDGEYKSTLVTDSSPQAQLVSYSYLRSHVCTRFIVLDTGNSTQQ